MHNPINDIIHHLFNKDTLGEVAEHELKTFIAQYPYSSVGRYLLAQKTYDSDPLSISGEQQTATLYINNPLWLQWLLNSPRAAANAKEPAKAQAPENISSNENNLTAGHSASELTAPAHQQTAKEQYVSPSWNNETTTVASNPVIEKDNHAKENVDDDRPIAFQSYHTIDYFASQGIRLQAADLSKDKLGQQLKSFTEWLKSMKKLPAVSGAANEISPEDATLRKHVVLIAEHSIEDKEIITEAMAEVWAKQGNIEKATAIYRKLSLQNPRKNAYFVAKIKQLNVS